MVGAGGAIPPHGPGALPSLGAGLGVSLQIGAGLGLPVAEPLGQVSLWQSCTAGAHPASAQQCLS